MKAQHEISRTSSFFKVSIRTHLETNGLDCKLTSAQCPEVLCIQDKKMQKLIKLLKHDPNYTKLNIVDLCNNLPAVLGTVLPNRPITILPENKSTIVNNTTA